MKKKKKIKRFGPKFSGNFIKIGGKCKNCMHSEETAISTRIKCTKSKPKTTFHKNNGWICYSFSQKILGNNDDEGGKQY